MKKCRNKSFGQRTSIDHFHCMIQKTHLKQLTELKFLIFWRIVLPSTWVRSTNNIKDILPFLVYGKIIKSLKLILIIRFNGKHSYSKTFYGSYLPLITYLYSLTSINLSYSVYTHIFVCLFMSFVTELIFCNFCPSISIYAFLQS